MNLQEREARAETEASSSMKSWGPAGTGLSTDSFRDAKALSTVQQKLSDQRAHLGIKLDGQERIFYSQEGMAVCLQAIVMVIVKESKTRFLTS